jgi:hypothetical protein
MAKNILRNNIAIKEKLQPYLLALLGSNALIELWWKSQNKAFSYRTPEEMLDIDSNVVVNYVYRHSYGE